GASAVPALNGRRRGASAGDSGGRTTATGTQRAGGSVHTSGVSRRPRGRAFRRTLHRKAGIENPCGAAHAKTLNSLLPDQWIAEGRLEAEQPTQPEFPFWP